jgi:hypothetical protein
VPAHDLVYWSPTIDVIYDPLFSSGRTGNRIVLVSSANFGKLLCHLSLGISQRLCAIYKTLPLGVQKNMGGPDRQGEAEVLVLQADSLNAAVKPGLGDEELAATGNDFKSPDPA